MFIQSKSTWLRFSPLFARLVRLACPKEGKGKLKRRGGFVYDGQWLHGSEHGQGACRWDTGDQYIGMWQEGKQHGKGKCIYANGDQYEGQWAQGKRNGQGICTFANRDRYKGEWKDDKRHGRGTCKFADGIKFRGEWEEDGWVQTVADPAFCKAAGTGLHRSTVGETASFQIEARNEEGNIRLAGGDEFVVELEGPEQVHGQVMDNDNGTYNAEYCVSIAGGYLLRLYTGKPLAGSPWSVQVLQAEEIAGPGCPIHPPKAAQPKDPFEDKLKLWEAMAAVQYRTDGVADGWDSDEPDTETSEQKYIKANPSVPVVENLEDLWKVSKLQKERKARQQLQERRQKEREERDNRQNTLFSIAGTSQSDLYLGSSWEHVPFADGLPSPYFDVLVRELSRRHCM
ncbi:hypothetical protein WJX84_008535 [Apatococcus fuscideae]|uniref:MORN repeat-containing protein 3 n=1 Tax=Apatococcus fuscideae TaxID=2026836 RepID=A0AAW1SWI7_9CHLO